MLKFYVLHDEIMFTFIYGLLYNFYRLKDRQEKEKKRNEKEKQFKGGLN